ncbi:MAG: helix-turn-helix transcriptional regulator [Clostridia bacterium]|nr:helix-turn-helix transcriptional regulator [Clostridia bacterium]
MGKVTKTLTESVTSENKKKICGERLRACREKKGLTQEELIMEVEALPENNGKSRNEKQVSYIENGTRQISAEYARLFGKVLGVQASYLLGETDYETEAARFYSAIDNMNKEGDLLYSGLCAFAMLTNYEITPPNLSNASSIQDYFDELNNGYKIRKDNQTVVLSLGEMNRFENEICDFVELKLIHLFKEKAGVNSGNSK